MLYIKIYLEWDQIIKKCLKLINIDFYIYIIQYYQREQILFNKLFCIGF